MSFDEIRRAHRAINQLCLGRGVVETSAIVGSVTRHQGVEMIDAEVTEVLPPLMSADLEHGNHRGGVAA